MFPSLANWFTRKMRAGMLFHASILAATAAFALGASSASAARIDGNNATEGFEASGEQLQEYALVGQWPRSDWPLDTLAGRPAGLAAATDGTVYLADDTANRITVMDAAGNWVLEFGNTGSGPERLGRPRRIEIDNSAGKLFVSDTDSYRIVVYDLDGNFVEAWEGIYASDMDLAPDGLLWTADVLTNQIRAFTHDGVEQFSFGERGSGLGQFRELTGISVAPSGDVYVGDRGGTRVQVFKPDPEQSSGGPLRLVRTLDLTDAKYQNTTGGGDRPPGSGPGGGGHRMLRNCSSVDMTAIDDDTLLLYPCLVENGEVQFLTSQMRSEGILGFFSPYVNAAEDLFYALGMHSSNPDDLHDPTAERSPVVIRFVSGEFRVATDVWKLEPFDEDRFRSPGRVDVHPSGSVYVTDWRRVFHYSVDGQYQSVLPRETFPSDPISVTLQYSTGDGTPDGVIGLGQCHQGVNDLPCLGLFTAATKDYRGEPRDYLEPVWTTTLPSNLAAPVIGQRSEAAVVNEMHFDPVNDLILVLNNDNQELLAYPRLGRGRKDAWALGGTAQNALYADVGSGPDGDIYILDVLRDEIQVRNADGDLVRRLPAPSDSWRIAGGPDGAIFLMTSFGEVLRLNERGVETARFDVRPNEYAQARNLSDLSVAADGRVFVADRQASLISVFAPTGGEAPVRAGETCVVKGDKTASPGEVPLGDTLDVELVLDGSCGAVEEPTNILLLVNTKSSAAFNTARQIMALADFSRHEVGLMGYYVNTLFKVRWTQDVSKLIAGLEQLNAGGGSESSERNALTEAHKELGFVEGRGVVVLIGAEYCVRSEDTDCQEQHDAEEVAGRLAADGYRVVVANGTADSALLATSDLDALSIRGGDLSAAVPVYQRVASFVKPEHLLKSAAVVDVVPDNMEYIAGSAAPPAAWDLASRTLTWSVSDAPYGGHNLTYTLRPMEGGRWPTNVEAHADYTDGWDGTGRVAFPVPEVNVVAPSTPSPTPTASPTPQPTATPTPGPTAAPRPVYLPIAFLQRCSVERQALDVALVIDISSSMDEATSPGGQTKIDAARQAASGFVATLGSRDRVAVVAFDAEPSTVVALTFDHDRAGAAIAGLETGYGTRIDLGLVEATGALETRRDVATGAIVLLTDGRPSTERENVTAAAAAARASGLVVYTIGLGSDVDAELLIEVAGSQDRYFEAPRAEDLDRIYGELAKELVSCP